MMGGPCESTGEYMYLTEKYFMNQTKSESLFGPMGNDVGKTLAHKEDDGFYSGYYVSFYGNGLYSFKLEVESNNEIEIISHRRSYGVGAPPVYFDASKYV
ncbi:DgyrCDS7126 [Dimorphilus gyrociliatus]|uniref:DgyrCDS7126 n=1 Tax=Dimorphilus gyrociliatus TaxID=2664684 RepID=A0A7I8VQ31_9ANNE|nr:DgyrCDS7126 [Dimorphilus gyrociliatus]